MVMLAEKQRVEIVEPDVSLLPAVVIVDILRFDKDHIMVEHWDVVQRLPEPDYDPMALSSENLTRFKELFA